MSREGKLWLRSILCGEKCAACGDNATRGQSILCPACAENLNQSRHALCTECGCAYTECMCVPKKLKSAGMELLVKLGEYDPSQSERTLNRLILRLKDRGDGMCAEYIAAYLINPVSRIAAAREFSLSASAVTYAPRSPRKRRASGTDPARLLARKLSDAIGAEFVSAVERTRSGTDQKSLTFEERFDNVRGLYTIRADAVRGRTVFLVDDVVTSGATMRAITEQLYAAGAAAVFGICIGRTLLR